MEACCRTVDQRFCPSIDEGEAHLVMIGKKLFQVKHYVYRCVGGVAKTIKELRAGGPLLRSVHLGKIDLMVSSECKEVTRLTL